MADCFLEVAGKEFEVELLNTATARIFYDHLPLNGSVKRFGEDIIFDVALPAIKLEHNQKTNMNSGDIGLWIEGSAICISVGNEAPGPVNVFGRLVGEMTLLRDVQEGELINFSK